MTVKRLELSRLGAPTRDMDDGEVRKQHRALYLAGALPNKPHVLGRGSSRRMMGKKEKMVKALAAIAAAFDKGGSES